MINTKFTITIPKYEESKVNELSLTFPGIDSNVTILECTNCKDPKNIENPICKKCEET